MNAFAVAESGQDAEAHRRVARRSCLYAAGLLLFFLVFGNLVLRIFSVPLSMVRMVGGIVLIRIGFALFMPAGTTTVSTRGAESGDVAFVPSRSSRCWGLLRPS